VALADRRGERALERDVVLVDRLDGLVRDHGLAVLEGRRDVDALPLDGHVGGGEDVLDGLGDLGADAVTFYEGDCEFAIAALGTLELGDLVRLRCC